MTGQVISVSGDVVVIRSNEVSVLPNDKVTITKIRNKRSLSANGYVWVLIDKLAEKLCMPKVEIYKDAIRNIGGNNTVVCVQEKAVNALRESWASNGIGWLTEERESKILGCKNVTLYYGSSAYDTAQMSRLINIIVEEAKAQGIETRTPNEIAQLISLWGEKYEQNKKCL